MHKLRVEAITVMEIDGELGTWGSEEARGPLGSGDQAAHGPPGKSYFILSAASWPVNEPPLIIVRL